MQLINYETLINFEFSLYYNKIHRKNPQTPSSCHLVTQKDSKHILLTFSQEFLHGPDTPLQHVKVPEKSK